MEIKLVKENRKNFLDLLLLADEQEDMLDKYVNLGEMFALYDGDLKSICIVIENTKEICELKNLATCPDYQKMGYGKKLVHYILDYYKNKYNKMIVGTGNGSQTAKFYEKCGFKFSHVVENFFKDHYDHPILEDGKIIIDMVYLVKDL